MEYMCTTVHAQKYVKPGAYQLGELSLELELESVSNRITMHPNYLHYVLRYKTI